MQKLNHFRYLFIFIFLQGIDLSAQVTGRLTIRCFTSIDSTPIFNYSALLKNGSGIPLDSSFSGESNEIQFSVDITSIQNENYNLSGFNLEDNYPNPANPSTVIKFEIGQSSQTSLEIYNILGQKVRTIINNHLSSGSYRALWYGENDDGIPTANGVYFYKLVSGSNQAAKKLVYFGGGSGGLLSTYHQIENRNIPSHYLNEYSLHYFVSLISTNLTFPMFEDTSLSIDILSDTLMNVYLTPFPIVPLFDTIPNFNLMEDDTHADTCSIDLWLYATGFEKNGQISSDSLLLFRLLPYDSSKAQLGIRNNQILYVKGLTSDSNGVTEATVEVESPNGGVARQKVHVIVDPQRDIRVVAKDYQGKNVDAWIMAKNELGDSVTARSGELWSQYPVVHSTSRKGGTTGNKGGGKYRNSPADSIAHVQIRPSDGDTLYTRLLNDPKWIKVGYLPGDKDTMGVYMFPAPPRNVSGSLVDFENNPRNGIIMATNDLGDTIRALTDSAGHFALVIPRGNYVDLKGHIINPNHPGGFIRTMPRIEGTRDTSGVLIDVVPDLADSVYIDRDTMRLAAYFANFRSGSGMPFEGLKKGSAEFDHISSRAWTGDTLFADEQDSIDAITTRNIDPLIGLPSIKYHVPQDSLTNGAVPGAVTWVKKKDIAGASERVNVDPEQDGQYYTLVRLKYVPFNQRGITKERLHAAAAPFDIINANNAIAANKTLFHSQTPHSKPQPFDEWLTKIVKKYPTLTQQDIIMLIGNLQQ
ncbi:MAG: T9SS type A sorting domain-containing protein [Ignavibacteriales bacterium]|nr:T9SS type A sorting domain-containing protein [Ignavibacteriales bacterium]